MQIRCCGRLINFCYARYFLADARELLRTRMLVVGDAFVLLLRELDIVGYNPEQHN